MRLLANLEGEVYGVRLPGNPVLGEGKPENQNHAMIFTRGEFLQTIDMNQDGKFEEALKMRNLFYKTYVHTTIFPIHSQTLDFATHNPGERDISHNPVQTGTRSYQFFFLQKYVSNSFSHYLFF